MSDTLRSRMICDLAPEIQMAIRLRAVKAKCTTGAVVCAAMNKVFPDEVKEARKIIDARPESSHE